MIDVEERAGEENWVVRVLQEEEVEEEEEEKEEVQR